MGLMKKVKNQYFLILSFYFHNVTLEAYLERYMCAIAMVDSALETLDVKLLKYDYHKFYKSFLSECIAIWMMGVLTEIITKMCQNDWVNKLWYEVLFVLRNLYILRQTRK